MRGLLRILWLLGLLACQTPNPPEQLPVESIDSIGQARLDPEPLAEIGRDHAECLLGGILYDRASPSEREEYDSIMGNVRAIERYLDGE